jgi:hypothetical protein
VAANRGLGGEAGWNAGGGAGGSGIVILSYSTAADPIASIPGGLTYSSTTSGGNRIYSFTAGTGTVTF